MVHYTIKNRSNYRYQSARRCGCPWVTTPKTKKLIKQLIVATSPSISNEEIHARLDVLQVCAWWQNYLPQIAFWFGIKNQQSGDKLVKTWLQLQAFRELSNCLGSSPNLNVIKNCWVVMKTYVAAENPSSYKVFCVTINPQNHTGLLCIFWVWGFWWGFGGGYCCSWTFNAWLSDRI